MVQESWLRYHLAHWLCMHHVCLRNTSHAVHVCPNLGWYVSVSESAGAKRDTQTRTSTFWTLLEHDEGQTRLSHGKKVLHYKPEISCVVFICLHVINNAQLWETCCRFLGLNMKITGWWFDCAKSGLPQFHSRPTVTFTPSSCHIGVQLAVLSIFTINILPLTNTNISVEITG